MTAVEDRPRTSPLTEVEPETRKPRRRRRVAMGLAIGAALLLAGVGVWLWTADGRSEQASADVGPVATAVVERGTISATSSWDGTLGYGEPLTVTSSTQGVVTRLLEQGQAVEAGTELYRVNEQPTTLLQGEVPMYRDLAPGAAGIDVQQLETNLVQLGYGDFTADDVYTSSTAEAVRAWQAARGTSQTGTVGRGDVVFVPEGRRVDNLHVAVGELVTPGLPILDLTANEKAVSLVVELGDRELVEVDTPVTVVLPEGDEVSGTVSRTTVTQVPSASGGEAEGAAAETESVVQVEVRLDEEVPDDLVGAAVEVFAAIDQRRDVLLVPVNALLALTEGGYGLEVVDDDGTTSIVPVTTGLFADGKVEVEGDGIGEGTVVGVAGR